MNIRSSLFILAWILFFINSYSQENSKLSGVVVDSEYKPLAGVTVLIKQDSASQTLITDTSGTFEFTKQFPVKPLLTFSAVGYVTITDTVGINNTDSLHRNRYVLKRETGILKNISVTTRKSFIEQKIDRTVLNVDALVSNAGVTALDVLENAPGVVVSSDGAISLKGKNGVVIFIDDKPTYLSPADLANYLKTLPSGTLDKIEIMTNPPARYDAAGNAGVINIRTKKSRIRGFNGGVNLAFGQGRYSRTNNSVNFNYSHKKLNVFGTASYSINKGFNDLDIFRYYLNEDGSLRSTFFQNSYISQTTDATNLKLGADYSLSTKTIIGIILNGVIRPDRSATKNKSVVSNESGQVDSLITADNREKNNWKKGSVNMNYLHKYTADKELSFDLDYVSYTSKQDQAFLNGIYNPSGNLKSSDGLTGNLPSGISIYSVKGDYSYSFPGAAKLSAGGKMSLVSTNNAANYFTVINGTTGADFDKTNHFLYKEAINAAYLNFNKDWKQFSFQAGLRLERTVSDGHQLGNQTKPDSSFKRTYTNLFPTAYLLYKFDTLSIHQLSFSFGRRIDRPFYQDLNPFISPLDKFSIYVGNPYLQPTFTNAFEASHIFKDKITTTISFNSTADIVEETIDLANGIYISRPANIGKSSVLGLSLSGSLKPAKWWTTTLFAEVQERAYKGVVYDYILDTNAVYFGTNVTNQFVFNKKWTAEVSGNYRTGILVGQIISGNTGRVNLALAKRILNDKGSLKLNFRDIFRTGLNHGVITSIKGAYATYHNWGDTRSFFITFTYNFGKTTTSPRNKSSGAEVEQSRVKN